MYIRGYQNGVWVVEFGKLSGVLENGSFVTDIADGDTLRFEVLGLQNNNELLIDTELETEIYYGAF